MSESIARIDDPVIAINIANSYQHGMSDVALYHATRGTWRLSRERAERARYAFAVFRGVIREVYEIYRWHKAGETAGSWGPAPGRYEFTGRVVGDGARNKYIGKQMPELHGQNPIRYFNC